MTTSPAREPWYSDSRGQPIVFSEISARVTAVITVTHYQFESLIDCASRGCRSWADELKVTRQGFRIREWRTVPGTFSADPDPFTYHWHVITPSKLARTITRVCRGEVFECLGPATASTIRNLWLAPATQDGRYGLLIDDGIANSLVQLVAFGEIIYG